MQVAGLGQAWRSPVSLLHIGLLLLSFLFQATVEEVIFRGSMLSVVARKANVAVAMLLVSFAFCFLHSSPHQPPRVMLGTFLFSVFAYAWALRAGNIWGAMGWHAGWNWLLATGFELPVTGIDAHLPALLVALRPQGLDSLTGSAEGPEGSYLCSVFFVAAIAWIQWRKTRGAQNFSPTSSNATARAASPRRGPCRDKARPGPPAATFRDDCSWPKADAVVKTSTLQPSD